VIVADKALHASEALKIHESVQQEAQQKIDEQAEALAFKQFQVTEDSDTINVRPSSTHGVVAVLSLTILAIAFAIAGYFFVAYNPSLGYLFLTLSGVSAFASVFKMGKTMVVTIDKTTRTLRTQHTWLGIPYATNEEQLVHPKQFKLKRISNSRFGDEVVGYFTLNFNSSEKTIRVASAIKGSKDANVLKNAIVKRCFVEGSNDETVARAA